LASVRQSLDGESEEKGKVAAERLRLQEEVTKSQEQYQQLLATVNLWAEWRGQVTQRVGAVRAAQSKLLTAIDPALEAKLAVASPSGSGSGSSKAAKPLRPTLEKVPSAIAQAIADDEDVAQSVEDELAALAAMAEQGAKGVDHLLAEHQEALADLRQEAEARAAELSAAASAQEAAQEAARAAGKAAEEALEAHKAQHADELRKAHEEAAAAQEAAETLLNKAREELAAAANTKDALEKELQAALDQTKALSKEAEERAAAGGELSGKLRSLSGAQCRP
jgi:hypothetical protein